MLENFIEYMWYLLTTPLKKMKKALNKWYILCRVFGKRFDEVKEDILRARDEGMVATCSHEMLPVHGADRRLTRYEGELPENFRSRIAMYEEICKLGGTNEGVLLAVKTLGYTSPVLVRANDLAGENRWAEFYIVIVMDADEEHPISFDIMRKTVRKWKEVGAKDNYLFKYTMSIREIYSSSFITVLYKKYFYYYDYLKLDGTWELDGSHVLDVELSTRGMRWGATFRHQYEERLLLKQRYRMQPCKGAYRIRKAWEQYRMVVNYLKLVGEYTTKQEYCVGVGYTREYRVIWHEEHNLIFLDGTWSLDGSETIDAWQKTEVL